jgi:hypothetical protein
LAEKVERCKLNDNEDFIDDGSEEELEDEAGGGEETAEAAAAAAATAAAAADKFDAKAFRKELADLKATIAESNRAAEYWRGRAEGKGAPKAEEEEIALEDDLVDAISSGDGKRIAKVIKGLGFVRQSEVEQAIASTRQSITRDAALVRQYPDLADEQSEFFQVATKHYSELVADDPGAKLSPATLKTAAKMAKLELEGKGSSSQSRGERINRQSGERGSRSSANASSSTADLSPMQRRIIDNLRSEGSSLTEEGYRKRANSGVKMSGPGRRRAA